MMNYVKYAVGAVALRRIRRPRKRRACHPWVRRIADGRVILGADWLLLPANVTALRSLTLPLWRKRRRRKFAHSCGVRMRPSLPGRLIDARSLREKGSSALEAKEHAACVKAAKDRGLAALRKFHVFEHLREGASSNAVADSRWALTWKTLDGQSNVKARPVPKGSQGRDLKDGLVETAGCVGLRSSHLRPISLSALIKWERRSVDIRNALPQADTF